MRPSVRPGWRTRLPWDIALIVLLSAAAAGLTWKLTALRDHIPILIDGKAGDVWFEGDAQRVFTNLTDRFSNNSRAKVHPLFPAFALLLRAPLAWLSNSDNLSIVRLFLSIGSATWAALLYTVLRLLGCRLIDAVLFTLLGAASSAALFWMAIPETYIFGSASILAAVAVAALAEHRRIPPWLDIAAAVAAFSMTITNWMVALASLFARHGPRTALQLAVNSFALVVVLWGAQKFLIPSTVFFLGDREEAQYVMRPEPSATLRTALLDSMVMPDLQVVRRDSESLWPRLTVQQSRSWRFTHWGPVALISWVTLLGIGLWAAATLQPLKRFRLTLLVSIAGQLALHLVYGPETFLYVVHWIPLLVILTALGTLTRLRVLVLALAGILLISAAQHNYAQLLHALDLVVTHSA